MSYRIPLLAVLVSAAANLVSFLLLTGQPNPGMAAVSVLPLVAAVLLWLGRRAGLYAALVAAPVMVAFRPGGLAFDLIRPGDVLPFAVAAVQVLAVGVAVLSAVLALVRRDRAVVGLAGGAALGAAVAVALVAVLPQADDTGSLTPDQVAALPVVDLVNYRFAPAQLRVGPGEPVAFRFTNDTDDDHTFTIEALGVEVEVPSGRTRVAVVRAPAGQYALLCTVGDHEEQGMVGRLTVVEGAGTGAPAGEAHGSHEGAHHHG
ncbi:cupredoxin domain-containing protein [Saccharothrix hoggarensis]|uniref:Cupredoxin domain-containing protein n=1 Tax=Saccharothrix hoggarensis TaxID=913853 RepID=A0ABW3QWM7_9PSEU